MSCEIKLICRLSDPERIIRHLFSVDNSREFPENWLQSCLVSACPTGKTIVIAKEKRIVILKHVDNQFDLYYAGEVQDEDRIKAVICLPFAKEESRNKLEVEWTCLAVGYESGFVKFYTKDFILLYSQQFHEEEVCSIKFMSKFSPRPDINYDHRLEEIFVHYSSAVCKISGERLFSVLGLCYTKSLEGNFEGQTANIFNDTSFTKWGYENQFCVNDSAVVGLTLTNTFDHLLAVATYDGFNASYRITPPIRYSVVAAGSKPALGFHYAAEYEQHVFFADVAKAVASKFKSALPSWFSGKQASVEKNTLAVQTPQAMDCRFGIHDLRRTATSIILLQNRRLALTADILGRVLLIDTHRGIVLHIFKGYRDAQCAFVQVKEEDRENKRGLERTATFIVIYSPKKGTLEIFCAQKIKKIAVFKVSKFSVLLYISHGLVGVTNITAARTYVCPLNCILVDPDGNINDIKIPFYFALPEKDSKKARDIFLYKQLKHFVKMAKCNLYDLTEKVLKIGSEIEFIDVHIECLKMLIQQNTVDADMILKFTNYLLQKHYSETEEIEESVLCHKSFILNLNKLSSLYVFLTSYTHKIGKPPSKPVFECNIKEMHLNRLQNLLDLLTAYQEDSFIVNEICQSFYVFLSVFEFEKLKLKMDLKPEVLVPISNLFFSRYLFDVRDDFLEFCAVISENKFCVRNLFEMLLHCWLHQKLSKHSNFIGLMAKFSGLMVQLLHNLDESYDINVGFNLRSEFWQEIREILASSSNPFLALSAAFVCYSVSISLDDSDSNLDEEFVNLTNEMCYWDGLIAKLDQMALLSVILSNKFRFNEKYCKLPKLKNKDLKFSLKSMEQKGKGAISEIVAKWLTNSGVNPDYVALNHRNNMKKLEVKNDDDEEQDDESEVEDDNEFRVTKIFLDYKELEWVFCQFNILSEHFHLSLKADVVLLNMCWEYANAWKNQIQEMSYLESSLSCVRYMKTILLKEGLMCLLWDTFLKIKFVNVCKFLNIVGQLPNQMLCVRETELTDLQIKNFLTITSSFLNNLILVIKKIKEDNLVSAPVDLNQGGDASSLAELALRKGGLNIHLVYVHFQLSRSLELMVTYTFKKKFIKPVEDIFDSEVVEVFYVDFHQTPTLRLSNPDTKTQKARRKFLIKVIVASARAIPDGESEAHINQHMEFTAKCIELAEMWELDVYEYKRLQVMELYIKGCDHQAYKLINLIPNLEKSGVDLLNIAAKRMYMIIMDSANPIGNQTCLSVDLSRYMKDVLIEKKEWCARGSLASVKFLATHAYRAFKEGTYQHRLSQHLLEAVEIFERVEASNAQLLIDKKREREEALKKLGY